MLGSYTRLTASSWATGGLTEQGEVTRNHKESINSTWTTWEKVFQLDFEFAVFPLQTKLGRSQETMRKQTNKKES